eukprot:TRINITY_DN110296_c0_g1_i1.p1 TRINITY_DN110296_c0_g1~~TRINITY_DN110296_c0_g1_i1.p1  ORF type:complete len:349 (-),score=110.90 TRINITY_DN110296_c0_g1_i1:57-1103(-)
MAWKGSVRGQPAPRYKGGAAAPLALPAAKGGGKSTGKGGKGYARVAPAENLATVQADFEDWAQYLADLITDLNQPVSELSKAWNTVTSLRARLIDLHEGMMTVVSPRSGGGGGGEEVENHKGMLASVYGKRKGTNLTKGDLVYTVEALAEGGFVATVSGELLEGGHYTGEPASSKKAAEHAAALAALMQDFPESLDAPQPKQQPRRGQPQQPPPQQHAPPQGEKRKRQADEKTFKARLHEMVQTLNGGVANKDDIVYETSPVDGDNGTQPSAWISKVYFPNYNAGLVYEGEPQNSKKDAESSAAAVAVMDLEDQVAPLEAERKAKKQKQAKEKEAARRALKEKKDVDA